MKKIINFVKLRSFLNPKAKLARWVLRFFGVLVLLIGVAAGVILVQQEQEIREKAITPKSYVCKDVYGNTCTCCKIDSPCQNPRLETTFAKCIAPGVLDTQKYIDSSCTTLCGDGTPKPPLTTPPSTGCGKDQYPQCKQGTCPGGKVCKKDEKNQTCKCVKPKTDGNGDDTVCGDAHKNPTILEITQAGELIIEEKCRFLRS